MRTALLFTASVALLASRPLQVDDLFKVKRVTDPQLSPRRRPGLPGGHRGLRRPTSPSPTSGSSPPAASPRSWTWASGSQTRPRFSPDGKQLAYQSGGQVWIVDLGTREKRQLTQLSGGAEGQIWSPDGKWLAFLSTTVPSGVEAENAAYLKRQEESKVTGAPLPP